MKTLLIIMLTTLISGASSRAASAAPAPAPGPAPAASAATPGSWAQVGAKGGLANTLVATGHKGAIFTIDTAGALIETDPASGRWRKIGQPHFASTRVFVSAKNSLYTIETNGTLYAVNPKSGVYMQLGASGLHQGVSVAAVQGTHLYAVNADGGLYDTDLMTGTRVKVGKRHFGKTRFMMVADGALLTIETDGNLYRIDPATGAWRKLGQDAAWAPTIVAIGIGASIYTIERAGGLYRTDPKTGKWTALGSPDFATTKQMVAVKGQLYTIEADGTAFRVALQ